MILTCIFSCELTAWAVFLIFVRAVGEATRFLGQEAASPAQLVQRQGLSSPSWNGPGTSCSDQLPRVYGSGVDAPFAATDFCAYT